MLKWPQRMAITIGFARGVQFLHTGVAPGIFGNNLKIENVLLDNSLSAKISDYNILLPFKVREGSNIFEPESHFTYAASNFCGFILSLIIAILIFQSGSESPLNGKGGHLDR